MDTLINVKFVQRRVCSSKVTYKLKFEQSNGTIFRTSLPCKLTPLFIINFFEDGLHKRLVSLYKVLPTQNMHTYIHIQKQIRLQNKLQI